METRKGGPSVALRVLNTHPTDHRDFLGRRKNATSDDADELNATMNRCRR